MKARSPILGYNHNIRYAGRLYHVQTEDSGVGNPHIFTHLFHGGTILATKRIDYHAEDDVPAVQRVMQVQHKLMLKELRSGEFDPKIEKFFGEPVARNKDTDPNIESFEPASSQRKTDPNMRALQLEAETAPSAPVSAEGRPLRGYPTPPPGTVPTPSVRQTPIPPPTPPEFVPSRSKAADMAAVHEDGSPVEPMPSGTPTPVPGGPPTPVPVAPSAPVPVAPSTPVPVGPPPVPGERRPTTQPVATSVARSLSRPPASRPVNTPNPMSGRTPLPRTTTPAPSAYSREPSAEGVVIARPAVIVTDLSPRSPVSTLTPPRGQPPPPPPPRTATTPPPPVRQQSVPPPSRVRVETPARSQSRPPMAVPGAQRGQPGGPRSPTPTPPPLAKPHRPDSDNIFGEDVVAEKSLDDVILAYLSEDLDK